MAALTAFTVQPKVQKSKNDSTSTKSTRVKSMKQEGPLSPPLSSLYMDRYPERLEKPNEQSGKPQAQKTIVK